MKMDKNSGVTANLSVRESCLHLTARTTWQRSLIFSTRLGVMVYMKYGTTELDLALLMILLTNPKVECLMVCISCWDINI